MTSLKDPNVVNWFSSAMEDIQNKIHQTSEEITETAVDLSQSHKQFLKLAADTTSKKCKDDILPVLETIQTYKKDMEQKLVLIKEKRETISETLSEIERKEAQKEDISLKIDRLKKELAKRRELIESQNRANKDRLKILNKANKVFEDNLGLEIRKIQGEKLQFIFKNINPANQDSIYTFIMGLDDGSYQIVSSDPVIESLSALGSHLQETNNISAFLANIRKVFVAHARSQRDKNEGPCGKACAISSDPGKK